MQKKKIGILKPKKILPKKNFPSLPRACGEDMTLRFVERKGILHMRREEDDCTINLYTPVCDRASFFVERELLACAMDRSLLVPGPRRCSQRTSLATCIAILVAREYEVTLTYLDAAHAPRGSVFFYSEDDVDALDALLCTTGAFAPSVLPNRVFVLQTIPPLSFPRMPGGIHWQCLMDHDDLRVQVATLEEHRIRRYHNGILDEEEVCECTGLALSIEGNNEYDFPDEVTNLNTFMEHFLPHERIMPLAKSRIVSDFVKKAHKWKAAIWDCTARFTEEFYKSLLRTLPDEYVMLLDARRIVSTLVNDTRVQQLGMIVARRLYPVLSDQSGDLHDDMVNHLDVHAIATLPFTKERFRHLYNLGFFSNARFAACDNALLTMDDRRVLLFPYNVDASDMTVAMATLLKRDVTEYCNIGEWILSSGKVCTQTFKECGHDDSFEAFFLNLDDPARIGLALDRSLQRRCAQEAQSIDFLSVEDIPFDAFNRRDHATLKTNFPQLFERLGARAYENFLVEVTARKTCHTWCYEDIDNGGNLSSLGLSILLTLILTRWHGAKARVFVSAYATAMVGVFMGDGEMLLVDPCATRCNGITQKFDAVAAPMSRFSFTRGSVLEVKGLHTWHVAVVLGVYKTHAAHSNRNAFMRVRLLGSTVIRLIACAQTSVWRRLARNSNCDCEKELKRLVLKGARGAALLPVESESQMLMKNPLRWPPSPP